MPEEAGIGVPLNQSSDGFELVTLTRDSHLSALQQGVNERTIATQQLCLDIKQLFNAKIDEICKVFTTCANDQRSYFSIAYLFGALPQSLEEVCQQKGEIKQETVDKLLQDFQQHCEPTRDSILRLIQSLELYSSHNDVELLIAQLHVIEEIDNRIKADLEQSPSWMKTYVCEKSP